MNQISDLNAFEINHTFFVSNGCGIELPVSRHGVDVVWVCTVADLAAPLRDDATRRDERSNPTPATPLPFLLIGAGKNEKNNRRAPEGHIHCEARNSMASGHRGASVGPSRDKSYFEQQREALLGDIAMVRAAHFPCSQPLSRRLSRLMSHEQSFEQVLGNINKLNRSLESIIAVRFACDPPAG